MQNECTLTGTVTDKIHSFEDAGTHEHLKYKGENLYEVTLDVARLSGSIDRMRVVIPEHLLKEDMPERIHITGAFQSRNDSRGRLILYIMTTTLEPALTIPDENRLVLSSYICKKPVFRELRLAQKSQTFSWQIISMMKIERRFLPTSHLYVGIKMLNMPVLIM